jgi:glutamate N-acetyltransferase/amino-acid N-acetyltransferase
VATEQRGIEIARACTGLVAEALDIAPEDVLPSSTGVIGRQMPLEIFRQAIPARLRGQLHPYELGLAAQAIMTTDTRPKTASASMKRASMAG